MEGRIELAKCFRSARRLQILVCGKAGVGKSSLINSFFGFKVCEVNDPGLEGGNLRAGTTKVERAPPFRIGSIVVDIFDSPGLQDGEANEYEYLDDMYKNCKDVDLFLYCIDMTIARFSADDIKALELFTKKFGVDFWNRCVLVLTKANGVIVPPAECREKREREYHKNVYKKILTNFRKELGNQGVSEECASNIPACAAGLAYVDDLGLGATESEVSEIIDQYRNIWYVSDYAEPSDQPVDFLTELWMTCLERMPVVSRIKLAKCTENRLADWRSEEYEQARKEQEEIIAKLNKENEELKEKFKSDAESIHARKEYEQVPSPSLDERQCKLKPNKSQEKRLVKLEKENTNTIEQLLNGTVNAIGLFGGAILGYFYQGGFKGVIDGAKSGFKLAENPDVIWATKFIVSILIG